MNDSQNNWQNRFLAPKVKLNSKIDLYCIIRFIKLLIYSLWLHEEYKGPKENLPKFGLFNDANFAYTVCHELYERGTERIKFLEEKANKLLPFITIIMTIISFVFLNAHNIISKKIYLVAGFIMLLSLLISLRCTNIKTKCEYFVPTIFDASKDNIPPRLNKKEIAHDLLEMAIFNQNISDDIADMLKCARILLSVAFVFIIIGFSFSIIDFLEYNQDISKIKINVNINIDK